MDIVVIEQTKAYKRRMRYVPETNTFVERDHDSFGTWSGVSNPYGWLKSSGTPPGPHLDVILVSKGHYELGDEVPARIVGCSLMKSGDHKLIAVPQARPEEELKQLPQEEQKAL